MIFITWVIKKIKFNPISASKLKIQSLETTKAILDINLLHVCTGKTAFVERDNP